MVGLVSAAGIYAWLFVDLPSLDTGVGALKAGIDAHSRSGRGRVIAELEASSRPARPIKLDDIPQYCARSRRRHGRRQLLADPAWTSSAFYAPVWINLQGGEVLSAEAQKSRRLARNLLLSPQSTTTAAHSHA